VNDDKSIRELMDEYGYQFKGSCHCDGYYTEKFKREEFEVRWRKGAFTFRLFQGRHILVNWARLTELENHLKQIHCSDEEKSLKVISLIKNTN
jgi:hypothetical protein